MLESLFIDRNMRKQIKEAVLNANESGFGTCDTCSENASLIKVFNHNICEACCNNIISSVVENYDMVFVTDVIDEEEIINKIKVNEAYLIPNAQKLQDEADKSFGGSIPNLMKSYGLSTSMWNSGDCFTKRGKVQVSDSNVTSGKTKINHFIEDFECTFATEKSAQKLVPDADGFSASVSAGGKNISPSASSVNTTQVPSSGSAPATVANIPKQTSTTVTNNTQVPKPSASITSLKASAGSGTQFDVKLANDVILRCERTALTMGDKIGVDVFVVGHPNTKINTLVNPSDDNNKLANEIANNIKDEPDAIFTAFTESDIKNGYTLNKYPAYSFLFDDKSFDGAGVSLVLALNGKPYEKSRVVLPEKALFSKASLNSELLAYMDNKLTRIYPALFNGAADVKTSIGKASSELVEINPSSSDKLGEVTVHTELGNVSFDWKSSGSRFKSNEETKNAIYDIMFMNMGKLIPGWDDKKLETKLFSTASKSFGIENLDDNGMKYSVGAAFDLNDLYDTGNIIIKMSVIDDHSGEEQPKKLQPFIYNQAGVKLEDFLIKKSRELHSKYFSKSDATHTMSASAQEKLKTPSKRQALYSRIEELILKELTNNYKKDVYVEIEDFSVNKDGKLISVKFRVYDEDNVVAGDSDTLSKALNLDKVHSGFLKIDTIDKTPKGLNKFGPSVVYKVTNLDKFSEKLNLSVLESAIYEAFGITFVNESGRKQIAL